MTRSEQEPKHDPGAHADDPNGSHAKMLALIGRNKTVIDFGCSDGTLARALRANGCRVAGIEVNRAAAAEAAAACDEVIVADLDVVPIARMLQGRTFDVAVFGDVLEHLRDPWRILVETRDLLAHDGYVVASIANVAHWAIRLSLLAGRFDYVPLGILDDTHLRFFTRAGLERLFRETGYEIETLERTSLPVGESNGDLVPGVDLSAFPPEFVAQLANDEDAATVQFVVRARRVPSIVTELKRYDTIAELVASLTVLRADDNSAAELRSLRLESETLAQRLAAAQHDAETSAAALADARAELGALAASLAEEQRARAAAEESLRQAAETARRTADLAALIEHWETQARRAQERADATNADVARLRRELSRARESQRTGAAENRSVLNGLTAELRALQAHAAELEQRAAETARAEIELARRIDAESRRLAAESDQLEFAIAKITNGPVGRLRRWLRRPRGRVPTQV